MPERLNQRFGWAWVAVTVSLALHVTDETLTDFLPFYNSLVRRARMEFPYFPAPTFTFEIWLTGLVLLVALLSVLSWWAFAGKRWMIVPGYILGVIMLLNGLGHTLGSIYFGHLLPGVYSSPLLLASSLWLLKEARQRSRQS